MRSISLLFFPLLATARWSLRSMTTPYIPRERGGTLLGGETRDRARGQRGGNGPAGRPPWDGDEVRTNLGRWDGDSENDQVPSHAANAPGPSYKLCMVPGLLCFFPIQKIPPWDVKLGHSHFFTKRASIRARRDCKKGKSRGCKTWGGRLALCPPSLAGAYQILGDK